MDCQFRLVFQKTVPIVAFKFFPVALTDSVKL